MKRPNTIDDIFTRQCTREEARDLLDALRREYLALSPIARLAVQGELRRDAGLTTRVTARVREYLHVDSAL
jgi:hypothetical protein